SIVPERVSVAGRTPQAPVLRAGLPGQPRDDVGVLDLRWIGVGAGGPGRREEASVRQPDVPELAPEPVDVATGLVRRVDDASGRQQVLGEGARLRAVA